MICSYVDVLVGFVRENSVCSAQHLSPHFALSHLYSLIAPVEYNATRCCFICREMSQLE